MEKKKAVPIRRSIYLLERITKRRFSSVLSGKREIKIGIAKKYKDRHQTVDAGTPGEVIILAEYTIDKASTVEAFLHRKYNAANFTVKGAKKNAGGSEWFQVTNRELKEIKKYLESRDVKAKPKKTSFELLIWIVLFLSIFITILIKLKS